jgi:hypothetical protein
MERIRTRALARVIVGAAVCTLALIGWSGAALASAPTVTLSGWGDNGYITPDSFYAGVSVEATLSEGHTSGSLTTEGRIYSPFGSWYIFTGNVTCMVLHGNQVTVGAFGNAVVQPFPSGYLPPEPLPGTYAQVLTVEFGEFPGEEKGEILTDSFGMLGERPQEGGNEYAGLQSVDPPNCRKPYSFANQILPTGGGVIHISPSITSPRDGYVSRDGIVKLAGTGEPNRAIRVYEVGNEASGTEVTANAEGKWSLTLSGVSAGTHVFTASAVNGSAIPANTVEIEVAPPPRHHHGRGR